VQHRHRKGRPFLFLSYVFFFYLTVLEFLVCSNVLLAFFFTCPLSKTLVGLSARFSSSFSPFSPSQDPNFHVYLHPTFALSQAEEQTKFVPPLHFNTPLDGFSHPFLHKGGDWLLLVGSPSSYVRFFLCPFLHLNPPISVCGVQVCSFFMRMCPSVSFFPFFSFSSVKFPSVRRFRSGCCFLCLSNISSSPWGFFPSDSF